MEVTKYKIKNKHRLGIERLRIALVADLHDKEYTRVIDEIRSASPDIIAVAGDLMHQNENRVTIPEEQEYAIEFLEESVKIAPTFYSFGNHERVVDGDGKAIDFSAVWHTGAVLLDNEYVQWKNGIWIGGLSSAYSHVRFNPEGTRTKNIPDTEFIEKFDSLPGFKILLCHHPEYYPDYLAKTSIDIILSGHAHGGQWRIFGRGIYSPSQGLFPKLTEGVHDNRLVISRGLANTVKVPRINNPTELVIVDVRSRW